MKDELIVMRDSDEAAQYVTNISGWVSRHGRFYGEDEDLARYDGCTHVKCETCGAPVVRNWLNCETCRRKDERARYDAMPWREWDGDSPITLYDGDEFFFDEDSLLDYCDVNNTDPATLMLVHCVPNRARRLDEDYFVDELPDDGDLPHEILRAIDAFNEAIKDVGPLSWGAGKERAIIGDDIRQRWAKAADAAGGSEG